MKKIRIISFAAALAVLLFAQSFSAMAGDALASDENIKFLVGIGLLERDDEIGDTMTRSFWSHITARIFQEYDVAVPDVGFADVDSETEYSGDILKLKSLGIVGGSDGMFEPEANVTEEQASIMLLRILGYASVMDNADESAYTAKAAQIGIFKGINDGMTQSQRLLAMLANSLDIGVIEQDAWYIGKDVYSLNSEHTVLNTILGIEYSDGIFRAVGNDAIAEVYNLRDGEVLIGDNRFSAGQLSDFELSKYLGYYGRAYYKKSNSATADTLVYFESDGKTKELTVELDDVVSLANGVLKYENENGRTVSEKYESGAYIVYNGRPLTYIPTLHGDGTVTILKNSGEHDCLIIYDYRTCVVNFVADDGSSISGMNSHITLIDDAADISYKLLSTDGSDMKLSDLRKWDVITVFEDEDGERIKMIVSRSRQKGKVSAKTEGSFDDAQIQIAGVSYRLTREFYSIFDSVKIGDNGTFYFDAYGRAAAFDNEKSTMYSLAYLIDADIGKGAFDETLKVKLLLGDGSPKVYDVKLSDGLFKLNGEKTSAQAFVSGDYCEQVIRCRLDSDGSVIEIETASGTDACEGLYKIPIPSQSYFRGTPLSFNGYAAVDADTVVFITASDGHLGDDDYYSVSDINRFGSGMSYTVQAYGVGLNKLTAAALVLRSERNGELNYSSPITVVKGFGRVYDEKSGDAKQVITVWQNNRERKYVYSGTGLVSKTSIDSTKAKPTVADVTANERTIEPGDVVRFTTNEDGEVKFIQLLYDKSDDRYQPTKNPNFVDSREYFVGFGKVNRINDSMAELVFPDGTKNYYPLTGSTYMAECITAAPTVAVNKASAGDIRTVSAYGEDGASDVFVHATSGVLRLLVIYND